MAKSVDPPRLSPVYNMCRAIRTRRRETNSLMMFYVFLLKSSCTLFIEGGASDAIVEAHGGGMLTVQSILGKTRLLGCGFHDSSPSLKRLVNKIEKEKACLHNRLLATRRNQFIINQFFFWPYHPILYSFGFHFRARARNSRRSQSIESSSIQSCRLHVRDRVAR